MTAALGVREVLVCPECNGSNIDVAYLDKRVKYRDQQRCTCNDCRYEGRWWRFRKFQDIRITVTA